MPDPFEKQRVEIVKTDGTLGPLPVGERIAVSFTRALSREEAVARVFRTLKREWPSENPMCWTVEEPDA